MNNLRPPVALRVFYKLPGLHGPGQKRQEHRIAEQAALQRETPAGAGEGYFPGIFPEK
jgi:hypothetical protein